MRSAAVVIGTLRVNTWWCVRKLLDEWQTLLTQIRGFILQNLIWVYTVCSGLSVKICRVNAVATYFAVSITKTRLLKYTDNFTTKNWKCSDKKSDIFHISAQNIACGYLLELPHWGGSNEYQQSILLSRKKKNNIYPCKPQFYYIKVGLRGSKLYRYVFVMAC